MVNQNKMKSYQRVLLQNVQNEYSACSIPQRVINASILLAEQYYLFHLYVMEYNRNDPAITIVPYIFLFKNRRTIKDNQERGNQYTDLTDWHKDPSTTRRKDIRTPTLKWMQLMYQIGATLLQACVILPPADEKAGAHHFMKFNPYYIDGVTEKYIPSTRPGHYWSQMTCVSEYAEVIKRLDQYTKFNEVINNTLFIETVLYAILFDFVAFAGQYVGYYHEQSTLDKYDFLRKSLQVDILKENDPSFVMFEIRDAFLVVSRLCNGGLSGSQNVVIFTSEGMRCFSIESIKEAVALIDILGIEIIHGYISNGVYVYNQNEEKSTNEVIDNDYI